MLYLKGDEALIMALMRKEPGTAPLSRTARSRESADSVQSSTSSTYLQRVDQWYKKETDTIHHTIS
jgi:hypothetical protein